MPTHPTIATIKTVPEDDSLEDDWATLRGDLPPLLVPNPVSAPASPPLEPSPELAQGPSNPYGLEDPAWFADSLREIAAELSRARAKLDPLRSSLIFRAVEAGLNPSDLPENLWAGTASENRDYAGMVGYVPRSAPSSALGLRLLAILTMLQERGARRLVALHVTNIGNEISPEDPEWTLNHL
jgi:hypothetical protein